MTAFSRTVNPRKQGDAGMGIAVGWFASRGYTVCIPLTDSQSYDLVVDMDGLKKISVRTSTRRQTNGRYLVGLRTQGGNKTGFKIKYFEPTVVDMLLL